ncbi:MAG: diadenylate cyclase CdaA [Candidatus Omnitrophica bacterium]|nr:diadenylate cyclase CdaA [Candidatus Omnitrophota bacterium]
MFYLILRAVRGTRAVQMVQFLFLLIILTYICKILNFRTVYWVLTSLQAPIFIALVILYAPELRRVVNDLTQLRFFRKSKGAIDPVITQVVNAAKILSRRHVGALVVFEKSVSLQSFIDTGIPVNSEVSSELLVSIFSPLTPLHDGAVIIRENRLAAAACLLPLSEREEIDSNYGTRHRAALGLVEETDAVIVIVSEETGAMSLAIDGRITRNINPENYESILWHVVRKGGRT